MTNKIGPNDIGKHPEVIKKAQQELMGMDVLVCGGCHAAFHFVASFEEHKENCKATMNTKQAPDMKQNWAFLLWKSAQSNANSLSAWKLYQNWAQLDSRQQQAWIAAGQAIQTISRIGHGTVQETQVKVMRTLKTESDSTAVKSEPETSTKAEKNAYQKIDNSTNPPTLINRYMVKRTMNSTPGQIEVRECLAEKVTSRRMNSKKNTFEYLVKWSEYESTWEPKAHFDKAQELITECERKLAQQKAAALANANQTASPVGLSGRPERSSKVRAVTTMKSWCNTAEPAAGSPGGNTSADLKRKNTDSEAGESSQDESFGIGSPSPSKLVKTSPQVIARAGGPVRYFQKTVNGTPTVIPSSPNSAEVVIDRTGDKTSGVRRKPGVLPQNPVRREAQVKVVGRNETTSSGIVRVTQGTATPGVTSPSTTTAASAATPTATSPAMRMQKVIQTSRTPQGTITKRTIYRSVPATQPIASTTSSPAVARPGTTITRSLGGTAAAASPRTPFQPNRSQVTRTTASTATPAPAYKISPNNQRVIRTPTARPLKAVPSTSPAAAGGRVVRASPGASMLSPKMNAATAAAKDSTEEGAADGDEFSLCPVTGKLITKAQAEAQQSSEDAESELQRLLTNEEDEAAAAAMAAEASAVSSTQIHELIQNEDGSPVMITGDDGTVYQVAGKNAEGQTLLLTQGEDGEQQCVIMASPEEEGVAAAEGVHSAEGEGAETQMLGVDGDSQDGQITAELVQADEPSADGTRRVVLLLPDGNLMVSELNEEQYQQFNLGA